MILPAALPIIPLAMHHRFGAFCLVAGISIAWVMDRKFSHRWRVPTLFRRGQWAIWKQETPRGRRTRAGLVIAAGCALLLIHQAAYRQHLPVSDFQKAIDSKLLAESRIVLLAPPDNLLLQATTNYPVLADVATPSLISYLPAIGPSIESMYRDIYGITFQLPEPGTRNEPPVPWQTLWRERDQGTWYELSERYEFTFVLAPINLPVQLTEILADEGYALYAVGR